LKRTSGKFFALGMAILMEFVSEKWMLVVTTLVVHSSHSFQGQA
jgi:hypothetical protein